RLCTRSRSLLLSTTSLPPGPPPFPYTTLFRSAIEDAATLKGCLLKFPSDVPAALRLYERLRLPRASRLQGMSDTNKTRFHLPDRSEEHTSELQSLTNLVCRLLLEKKNHLHHHT